MSYEFITEEKKGRVGVITLNRPKQLNALSPQLMQELGAALQAFDADAGIGAILITGSEKAFAAGADIGADEGLQLHGRLPAGLHHARLGAPPRVRKPVIAAVAGYALGGGNELAMMCDIVIAADNAKFGQPEINLGVMPGAGGTQRLPRAVGKAKAMDMCLTARMMDAQEAERAGLVSRVVPLEQADGGGDRRGGEDRRLFAARGDDDQGVDQPRLRDLARRGRARSSGACSIRSSRSRTRRKAWRPSSRNANRSSKINNTPLVLLAAHILSMLGFSTYAALLPELRDLWGLSNSQAGIVGGTFFAGYIATVSFWTALTDRLDARKVYLAGGLLSAAGSAGFALAAGGFPGAVLFQSLLGIGVAGDLHARAAAALRSHLRPAAEPLYRLLHVVLRHRHRALARHGGRHRRGVRLALGLRCCGARPPDRGVAGLVSDR